MNEEKYWEIDRFYSKADSVLTEARNHAKKYEYDLCVRRSQEAFELFLKTMFKFISHKSIRRNMTSAKRYTVCTTL